MHGVPEPDAQTKSTEPACAAFKIRMLALRAQASVRGRLRVLRLVEQHITQRMEPIDARPSIFVKTGTRLGIPEPVSLPIRLMRKRDKEGRLGIPRPSPLVICLNQFRLRSGGVSG